MLERAGHPRRGARQGGGDPGPLRPPRRPAGRRPPLPGDRARGDRAQASLAAPDGRDGCGRGVKVTVRRHRLVEPCHAPRMVGARRRTVTRRRSRANLWCRTPAMARSSPEWCRSRATTRRDPARAVPRASGGAVRESAHGQAAQAGHRSARGRSTARHQPVGRDLHPRRLRPEGLPACSGTTRPSTRQDTVLVAAAGNDGMSDPSTRPRSAGRSASARSTTRQTISSFSNYGSVGGRLRHVGRNHVNAYPDGTYVCKETPDTGLRARVQDGPGTVERYVVRGPADGGDRRGRGSPATGRTGRRPDRVGAGELGVPAQDPEHGQYRSHHRALQLMRHRFVCGVERRKPQGSADESV